MQGQEVSKLILVVEDEEKNMKLVSCELELAGYRILKL